MLLTADIARTLRPATPAEQITDQIEKAVKNAARAGATKVDIAGLIAKPEALKWMRGEPTELTTAIAAELSAAGFAVATQEPTASWRGFINLTWAA